MNVLYEFPVFSTLRETLHVWFGRMDWQPVASNESVPDEIRSMVATVLAVRTMLCAPVAKTRNSTCISPWNSFGAWNPISITRDSLGWRMTSSSPPKRATTQPLLLKRSEASTPSRGEPSAVMPCKVMLSVLGVFPTFRTTAVARPSWFGATWMEGSSASMLRFFFSFMRRSKLHVVAALSKPDTAESVNRGPVSASGIPSMIAGTSTQK